MQTIQGEFDGENIKIAIVSTRWNDDIVDRLVEGAIDVLTDCGVDDDDVIVVKVPGAFELPLAVDRLAESGKYDGIIALGAVIRGDTPHFDYVAGECAKGLSATALEYGLPVGFGVITADNAEQADARAQPDEDNNKGAEAASAVIEMVNVLRQIEVEDE
ncbi:6,7-dimethyl-8-ribityllumazine synthase [Salinisphaera hydrothermalis]|uniref:6,7-dimethyl-8-ribityllumazine synthase n=1 Tax=Salinisphaera hydrothermalis (strain C41B8) TaxID=1304275 RepID=A0A084IMF7_SALHC|nr:6,7-dimethyl-8-ribityllumazine synthase [Salinisphaera hydrothermalis]KEZ77891.1 6,7-dimethyl-8-ribityllumazine synthase [Salinisphaera hydrothermalis C41B8]